MKKLSNCFKILLVSIIIITFVQISPVKASEKLTVTAIDSIEITLAGDSTIEITKDLFDLSKTDWVYVHYNSDGEPQIGFIDNDFQGITLESSSDRMVCTPKRESANFYSSLVRAEVNVEFVKEKAASGYFPVRFFDNITITAEKDIYFKQDGDFAVDLQIEIPGGYIGEANAVPLIGEIKTGDILRFKPTESINYDVNRLYLGGIYYVSGNANEINAFVRMDEKYTDIKEEYYDFDGVTYTITNNGSYDIEVTSRGTSYFTALIYDASGNVIGEQTNVDGYINGDGFIDMYEYRQPVIPSGGKVEFLLNEDTREGELLQISYYSIFDELLDISGVRKADPSENKNIYIHFPESALVPNGLLKDSQGYYLSREITYVDTNYEQPKDTIGGFSIPEIKDTTGMAFVNKWYVYNSKTGEYYESPVVVGNTLTVNPLKAGLYSNLGIYSQSNEYHLYAEWEIPAISKNGTYKLINDVKYSFGSGRWKVTDDACEYYGGMEFYIDDASGNYELTLQ